MIGLHLIIDAVMIVPISRDDIDRILRHLPGMIGMKILYGPVVIEGQSCNPGWTGFVIIDKSHISIHTFTEGNRISVDVFSCQPFDDKVVSDYFINTIKIGNISTKVLNRSES